MGARTAMNLLTLLFHSVSFADHWRKCAGQYYTFFSISISLGSLLTVSDLAFRVMKAKKRKCNYQKKKEKLVFR